MLAVVKQDVEGDLAPHQVVDGGLDHAVKVSDRVGVVQHVVDLQGGGTKGHWCLSITGAPVTFRWLPCTFSPAAPGDPF